ncbi:11791_t:CDS:2 [Acaulospora morrowiae]|uniref:11791_t:CDS:1 n=1 Tax=Acaulospora morrowiae TaxID=94023 RepID=A0A9N9N3D2_9GLOM|nr:11791_t:CDS:2 [Acaulospora morrowiae]
MDLHAFGRSKFPSQTNKVRPMTSGKVGYLNGKENMEQTIDEAAILFCGRAAGPPTRFHWKHDSEATKCAMTFCNREFNLFERRHHCRRCGDIFCGAHCSHYIRLDQNTHFNLAGFASRVCDKCYDDYNRLLYRCKYPEPAIYHHIGYFEEDDVRECRTNKMSIGNGFEDNTRHATREEDILKEDFNNINPYQRKQFDVTYGRTPTVPANWAWSTF